MTHRLGRKLLTALAAFALAAPLALSGCAPVPALPGVGPAWMAKLAGHTQVVVASGDSTAGTQGTLTLYDRTATGWRQEGTWREWNALRGWQYRPATGSLKSPIGVFSLTASGGYAPNPGTRLPYDHRYWYYTLFSHAVRTFNRVVAIDINHVPYSAPIDGRRPDGPWGINGIWLHDAHNSPSAGCVTIADSGMLRLQLWLNPAARPVILMGPSSELRR
jgi:L,D-peptidoglycan transpeptidase YkuD (ErfK/YbiS/YcfS/YnhG family)